MKLRIRENTIRFRLSRSEVDALADGRTVAQTTRFMIGQQMSSSIIPVAGPRSNASFRNGQLSLELSGALIDDWAHTALVGLTIRQAVDVNTTLSILIEKDFVCLHGEQDTPDAYPNPLEPDAAACATSR